MQLRGASELFALRPIEIVPPVIINNTDAFFIKIAVSESDVEITFFVRQNYKKMSNCRQTLYLLASLILLSPLGLMGCSVRYRFRFIGEDNILLAPRLDRLALMALHDIIHIQNVCNISEVSGYTT